MVEPMTLPSQRYLTIRQVGDFLHELASVPLESIMDRWDYTVSTAWHFLASYPIQHELNELVAAAPHMLTQELDPLYQACLEYQHDQALLHSTASDTMVADRWVLPNQRYHAMLNTHQWLLELAITTESKAVNTWCEIVDQATTLLLHYPTVREVDLLALAAPHWLCKTQNL